MQAKKKYTAPEIRSEKVAVGVFGDYNTCGGSGSDDTGEGRVPVQFWNPFLRFCCS